ncbi:MAG TPA: uroporphyrinogen-III C-methyltransferase [Cyclobacteriaceae bacterium]|nr:uroporphyrinogen-III C-methyltransferase [Cyclobacteriaceae bacterium]
MAKTTNLKVRLVGAGPGDPELITLKGLSAMKKADVILHDALVSKELLNHASPSCKLVNVGKRAGKHTLSQDEINRLIVFYATRYKNVARLKGGDPYVFGRGHEELDYIHKRGISVEIIPGISSAIAAPASVGIPLTKRGINESFWVITGTCSSGEMSNDIRLASQSGATVIILMGMNNLSQIVQNFYYSRGADEPVAIVQRATTAGQKSIRGTIGTIQQLVISNKISAPAVIIIGKVVNESSIHEVLKEDLIRHASI